MKLICLSHVLMFNYKSYLLPCSELPCTYYFKDISACMYYNINIYYDIPQYYFVTSSWITFAPLFHLLYIDLILVQYCLHVNTCFFKHNINLILGHVMERGFKI